MRLRAPAAKEGCSSAAAGPPCTHGDREKRVGAPKFPQNRGEYRRPSMAGPTNLRRRGADASRALQTFVPESAVVRHRESVIAGVSKERAVIEREASRVPRAPRGDLQAAKRGRAFSGTAGRVTLENKIGKALSHPSALPLLPLGPGGVHVSESTGPHSDHCLRLAGSGGRHLGCEGDVRPSRRRVESFLWTSFRCFSGQRPRLGCVRDQGPNRQIIERLQAQPCRRAASLR